jgi:hypothetical protein
MAVVPRDVSAGGGDDDGGTMTATEGCTPHHPWQEEGQVEEHEARTLQVQAAMLVQKAMIQITRFSSPTAQGSIHTLGWLALAVNVLDLPDAPLFQVAPWHCRWSSTVCMGKPGGRWWR